VSSFERLFRQDGAPHVVRGIGDDAAVLQPPKGKLVTSVDVAVENVHFRLDWLSLGEVGSRSFHAATSDLAARGATPLGALSSLVVPKRLSAREVKALSRGQSTAARELACPIVGGNLSSGTELSVTTTVFGSVSRPLLRSGARPGDELWLIGEVGLSRAGLLALERGLNAAGSREAQRDLAPALRAFRRPKARVAAGLLLRGRARAVIDVSDGLAKDASHLAGASGCRVWIDEGLLRGILPRALERAARRLETTALELALEGGEDYALLATGPANKRPDVARRIGHVSTGTGVAVIRDGKVRRLRGGFDHMR
jgi:thiamine-monophosphate kinase